jgi:LPXTG-motif cell wall-anchored protein
MNEFFRKNPWATLGIGIVLLVLGVSLAGQKTNGTNKQLIFDIVAIIGVILVIAGIVLLFKKRKSNQENQDKE